MQIQTIKTSLYGSISGIPVETIKPSPTLDGAYVRKSIEKGTDGINDTNDQYLWKSWETMMT